MYKLLTLILINFFIIKFSFASNLNSLEINGNKRLSTETIKVLGKIDLKKTYDDNELNVIIKNLYSSGFFKNILIKINNDTLIIDLIENPIIEDIQITGIKRDSLKDELLKNTSLQNRKPFSENFLNNDIVFIKNILKSLGYYFSEVVPSISIDDEFNTARIKIDINQGARAKIKNISFIGDKKIKDKTLLEIIASEEHKFWKFISNKHFLDQSRINLDKRLLENYYKNLGYYNIKILSSFLELDKNGNFNLTFNINSGDHYFFNDIKLSLPKDYNINDFNSINDQISKLKGEKFSLISLNEILTNIEKIASDRLYDFINAEVEEEIVEKNKINLNFNVVDTTSNFIERVDIFGNYNTIEEVIRNRLIVDEGDPLNNILYNKSIDNIKSLRIFKNVNSEIKDGSEEGLKKIEITVEEMPTGEISLAAGVGSSGSSIGGGVTEKNFLGKGINLSTNLELSENSIKGQFVYSKPNFAYTDNTLNTSLISTTTDNLSDFGYKVSELGLSLGTTTEQFENLFFSPELSISNEDLKTNATASTNLKKQEGNYLDLYLNYNLDYDLRNSKYKPTSGIRTSFYQELPINSDGKEIVNTFVYDHFKNLSNTNEMIAKTSFYFKAVNSIDSDLDVRASKRAYIPYSRLRGFESGKIGPVENNDYIGGNYVSTLNFTTDLPFILSTLENVDFSYFIDVANIWGVDYNKNLDDKKKIRSATGLGLDILTPVGPISFSLSEVISKQNTDKTESFRFNLGTSF
jgi:outer membrane protein insertion porin family